MSLQKYLLTRERTITNLTFRKQENAIVSVYIVLVYGNIDQTLVNSLHGLLIYEIGRLYCRVITTEYLSCVHCIHM